MKSRPGQGLTEISKKIRLMQTDHARRRTPPCPHTHPRQNRRTQDQAHPRAPCGQPKAYGRPENEASSSEASEASGASKSPPEEISFDTDSCDAPTGGSATKLRLAACFAASAASCASRAAARSATCRNATFSRSGAFGARSRSTRPATFTCSLVALKLMTARRISSLTLMPRHSAVLVIASFCAGVTNTTMRSLGFVVMSASQAGAGQAVSRCFDEFDSNRVSRTRCSLTSRAINVSIISFWRWVVLIGGDTGKSAQQSRNCFPYQ